MASVRWTASLNDFACTGHYLALQDSEKCRLLLLGERKSYSSPETSNDLVICLDSLSCIGELSVLLGSLVEGRL